MNDDLTPERAARMKQSFLEALAVQRRKRARKQKAKWALAAGLLAAALAAAGVLLRWATPHDPSSANAAVRVLSAQPPASGTSPTTHPVPDSARGR